jgi:signal peptidase I
MCTYIDAFGLGSQVVNKPTTYSFSIPLINPRPKPTSFVDKFIELWNDPRPISSLVQSSDSSYVGTGDNEVPYCIISDEFYIDDEAFQILLYPCGRFVGGSASLSSGDGEKTIVSGAASAYLRYLPKKYGDEIDIAWKLRLRSSKSPDTSEGNSRDTTYLQISTSGGLPRSPDTWSAAMTFCHELEAVESVGRATDWGSSIWNANQVCKVFKEEYIFAEGEVCVFAKRSRESSFAWPLFSKGGLGAVYKTANQYHTPEQTKERRDFRVGEVIVHRKIPGLESDVERLEQQFIYPGIDYRIMTMTDRNGVPIFTTESLNTYEDKSKARLALRPCGWKLQQELWKGYGMRTDWPVEVNACDLAKVVTTRFNANSAIPRIVSAFQRDWRMYSLALAVAMTPIPLALIVRSFISLYAIPSASMDPTMKRGDLMVVEKFPGIYQRTHRGDVILFRPPPALIDIVQSNGSQLSSTSLFVKRIVGLPGDTNIRLLENNDVMIDSKEAVGPDRGLCPDEPMRLIDNFLQNGKGTQIDKLNDDEVYVLGDCKAVSVDSRVFGILPKQNIVGKPIARIWPISRFKMFGSF